MRLYQESVYVDFNELLGRYCVIGVSTGQCYFYGTESHCQIKAEKIFIGSV